jgi:spore coat protein U-like protein
MFKRMFLAIAGLGLSAFSGQAVAQSTTTGGLEVRLLVTASCEVSGSTTGGIGTALLDFGTTALLLNAIEADTGTSGVNAFEVLCNPNVEYTVTFDAGRTPPKSPTAR